MIVQSELGGIANCLLTDDVTNISILSLCLISNDLDSGVNGMTAIG